MKNNNRSAAGEIVVASLVGLIWGVSRVLGAAAGTALLYRGRQYLDKKRNAKNNKSSLKKEGEEEVV
jgi:hypothetical protein